MTDHELVERCLKGNKKAQRLLFDRFYQNIFRIAQRYNRNLHDCEDVVLNVFNRVFQSLSKVVLSDKDSLEKWIHRISINESIRAYKNRVPESYVEDFENLEHLEYESKDLETESLTQAQLKQAMDQMPEGYKMVFLLKVLEGLTHLEISNYLNISINTSKSQMLKARKFLSAKIKTNEGRI